MSDTLKYPLTKLYSDDDWFRIQIYEHKPGNFQTQGTFSAGKQSEGNLLGQIQLPMPWNIPNNSQSAEWGSSQISPLAAAVGETASDTITGGVESGFETFKSNVSNLVKQATTGSNVQTITQGLAGLAAAQLGGLDPGQALSRFAGVTFNNNVELAFSGVSLRPASNFTFAMTPRNDKESTEVKNIIRRLKQSMSASQGSKTSAGGIFLSVPNVFKIAYMKGGNEHPFLNKFKLCALTGLSVDLSPSGYATYSDGTPVEMVLSLIFNELSPIYREDYDEATTSLSY